MKEHGLILPAEGVRALLAGATQIRVPVTWRNSTVDGYRWPKAAWAELDWTTAEARETATMTEALCAMAGIPDVPGDPHFRVHRQEDDTFHRVRPLWEPGDVLWGKETWAGPLVEDGNYPENMYAPEFCEYAATQQFAPEFEDADGNQRQGWKASTIMPRWASRIVREITGVRAQRLQDICEDDALASGVYGDECMRLAGPYCADQPSASMCLANLWDATHKPGQRWADNPPVWAITVREVVG